MISSASQSVDKKLDPLAVFNSFRTAYQSAASHSEAVVHTYQIAGYRVRLCFAGPALPPLLTPALAYLAIRTLGGRDRAMGVPTNIDKVASTPEVVPTRRRQISKGVVV